MHDLLTGSIACLPWILSKALFSLLFRDNMSTPPADLSRIVLEKNTYFSIKTKNKYVKAMVFFYVVQHFVQFSEKLILAFQLKNWI